MEKLLSSIDLAQFGMAGAVIIILLFVIWILWKQNIDLRQDLKSERDYNREIVRVVQDQQVSYIQTLRNLQEQLAILLDRG